MERIGQIARRLKAFDGLVVDPMPEWAFCDRCGLPRLHVPEVVAMVLGVLRTDSTDGVPRCKCDGATVSVEDLLRASNVPHQAVGDTPRTFENFDRRPGTEEALASAIEFAGGLGGEVLLTMCGPNGRGKSHLAEAVAREAMGRGVSVRYEFVPALLDAMREAGRDSVAVVMGRCLSAGLLVLDDMGLEKASDWTDEKLTSVVEQRMARHVRTVVTTNRTREELARPAVEGGRGYERLASRMWAVGTGEARVATFNGRVVQDYRITGGRR